MFASSYDMPSRVPVVLIFGPTAAGKSALACELAERISAEIISADSMQVYDDLHAGVAKPGDDLLSRVSHHLIGHIPLSFPYTVSIWLSEVHRHIHDIFYKRKRIPFIVGGTGLYLRLFMEGLSSLPPVSAKVRTQIKEMYEKHGETWLIDRLNTCDPAFLSSEKKTAGRMIRALEVYESSGGIPITKVWASQKKSSPYNIIPLGVRCATPLLVDRINSRCQGMYQAGLVEETERLLAKGWGENAVSAQALGYRHVIAAKEGWINPSECFTFFARDTCRFAKRQRTWFRQLFGPDDAYESSDRWVEWAFHRLLSHLSHRSLKER